MCNICFETAPPPDLGLEAWRVLQQLHGNAWQWHEGYRMWGRKTQRGHEMYVERLDQYEDPGIFQAKNFWDYYDGRGASEFRFDVPNGSQVLPPMPASVRQ